MTEKPKKIMIRIIFTAGISVMIFGVTGRAAAGEPVLSRALYAVPSPVSMPDRNAGLNHSGVHSVNSRNDKDKEVSPAEKLVLLTDNLGQTEWAPAEKIGLHLQLEPGPPSNRTGPDRPFLGFGWDRDAGNRFRWNIVFGLGLYISNSCDWYHPGDDLSPEAPVADREKVDFFEKIQNALQVVGFQVRYAF